MIGATNVEVEEWNTASGKRLGKGRTEISSFLARPRDEDAEEMHVDPQFTCGISIERVGIEHLKGFVHDIFEILTEIETGARPHPFATYPL